jgi:hypothetical protein
MRKIVLWGPAVLVAASVAFAPSPSQSKDSKRGQGMGKAIFYHAKPGKAGSAARTTKGTGSGARLSRGMKTASPSGGPVEKRKTKYRPSALVGGGDRGSSY